MDSFAFALFSFAVLGAVVSLIVFIIDAIRKKDLKKPGIVIGIFFILGAVSVIMAPTSTQTTNTQNVADVQNVKETQTNSELTNTISGKLGKDEKLQDVTTKDREIDLKIDLGNETNGLTLEDLACTRYAGITDYLLSTGEWDTITADFVNVGKITMDASESTSTEILGEKKKYFPLEIITKKFEKY